MDPNHPPEPSQEEIAAARDAADNVVPFTGEVKEPPAQKADLRSKGHQIQQERSYPQSGDAERGVLSSILLTPNVVIDLCVEKGITPETFYIPAHQEIYRALLDIHSQNKAVDFITLAEHLRDRKMLEKVGGGPYLNDLFVYLPTAANVNFYADILSEKATLRQIIKVCDFHSKAAYEEQDEPGGLLDSLERESLAIRRARAKKGVSAKDMAFLGLHELQRRLELGKRISGLTTGFPGLDCKTDGLHATEMIVIASLPSLGKSALAWQIVENLAIVHRTPVAFIGLEMGDKQFSQRMIASRARVNTTPWRYGHLPSEESRQALVTAATEIARAPIYFETPSDCTIQEIRAVARRLVSLHGIKVIVIDSMSRLHSNSRQARENRTREVAECAENAKDMAKELEITVIIIAHVGGLGSKVLLRNEQPSENNLRESAKIGQDADSLWLMWEPDFDADKPNQTPEIQVWIPKQRDGEPFVRTDLIFEKQFTRFREPEPGSEQGQLL